VKISSGLDNSLILETNENEVSISVKENQSQIVGRNLVIGIEGCFLELSKVNRMNIFRLVIWKDKKSYNETKRRFAKSVGKEFMKNVKKAQENWGVLYEGGKND